MEKGGGLHRPGAAVKREWPIGPRVADLLVLHGVSTGLLAEAGLHRASGAGLRILAHTLNRTLSEETLGRLCGLDVRDVRELAEPLVDLGLLLRGTGRNTYRTGDWAEFFLPVVTLVEAKLHSWTTAIAQADYYLRFSDSAYVVLAATNSDRTLSKAIAAARSKGIGLATIAPGQPLELLYEAPRSRKRDLYRWRVTALEAARYFCLEKTSNGPN